MYGGETSPFKRGILKSPQSTRMSSTKYYFPHSPPVGTYSTKHDVTDDLSLHQASISSYHDYPAGSKFVYDEGSNQFTRTSSRAGTGLPESSSRAVFSALKDLQHKIRRMERERTAAEDRLRNLSSETTQYRNMLHKRQVTEESTNTELSEKTLELQEQLKQAEFRCQSVEKQLDYMRKLVQRAEEEKNNAMKQQELTETYTARARESELRSKHERLKELERERERLQATQTTAESKIQDLEDQVREEMHHRKLVQDKAAELQTAAETNRILLEAELSNSPRQRKVKKKKKSSPAGRSKPTTPKCCTLRVSQIPFVAGKSTTPSHSVNANFQNVLAMMKSHHPAWCENGVLAHHGPPKKKRGRPKRTLSVTSVSSDSDLTELLLGLQEEFGKMGIEHHELAKQIQEAEDSNLREDLERELDHLVVKMEFKGDQIARLKRHKEQLSEKKMKKKTQKKRPQSARSTQPNAVSSSDGAEVEVVTTVRTKGKRAGAIKVVNTDRKNLRMLKDIQCLKTSLRKDDISWD